MEPPFDRIAGPRDPAAQRIAAATRLHRRRLIGGAVVAVGLLVLVISVLVSATSASGSTTTYATTATPSAVARPSPSPTLMLVQVVGQVRHPGLVHLAAGARAIDAVTAAGGALPNADLAAVNLAARVSDGQQLVLPKVGAAPAAASGTTAGTAASASSPISLGSASEAQLETLPRIGPAMAARIIAYRTEHGGFTRVDDLLNVGGIGAKTLAALKPLVVP